MIYVGQIYEQKNGEVLAVTQVYHSRHVSVIYSDGYVQNYDLKEDNGNIFEKPRKAKLKDWYQKWMYL